MHNDPVYKNKCWRFFFIYSSSNNTMTNFTLNCLSLTTYYMYHFYYTKVSKSIITNQLKVDKNYFKIYHGDIVFNEHIRWV